MPSPAVPSTHPCPTPEGVIERPASPLGIDPRRAREGLPRVAYIPETSLFRNLETSARRYPAKTAIQFQGNAISYDRLLAEVEAMAGYLQRQCAVAPGDRVLVFSQNCPQFIVAYFAVLRADAVFVPVNAMLLRDELAHIVQDSGAVAAFVASELLDRVAPLLGTGALRQLVVHAYGDAVGEPDAGLPTPAWLRTHMAEMTLPPAAVSWEDALARAYQADPHRAGPDDLSMLPYTSGTTGKPKACVHTHRTVMTSCVGSSLWRRTGPSSVYLAVAPLFHLLGLQNNVNSAIFWGATIVLMPRWDREAAATLIEGHRVTFWAALPAMLVDFFAQPDIEQRDLSSLSMVTGGGAATPQHVNDILKTRYGLDYVEGYGLTESANFLCANPMHQPKKGCLGVPTFGVDLRIVDPETLQPVPQGEVGEIVAHGAQIMLGYWNHPKANAESFIVIDGKRFFRTGDLATMDADGFVFMRDRLKRMINASGFKVWPAEVEASLNTHPAILEACVISSPDKKRGETVKAVVALRSGSTEDAASLLAWCREHMAVYKAPRLVQIVDALPKNATGKIAWRELQEREAEAAHAAQAQARKARRNPLPSTDRELPAMSMTLALRRALQATPERTATVFHQRRQTFREFGDRVARLAGALQALGMQPGDRVGMLGTNSDRWLEVLMGVWWGGGVLNPVNTRWSVAEIVYSLDDCNTGIVVVDDHFLHRVEGIRASAKRAPLFIYAGEGNAPEGMASLQALILAGAPVPDADRVGSDLACILYTGGTTGFPKGVMHSHWTLWAIGVQRLAQSPMPGESIALHVAPLFHMGGIGRALVQFIAGETHVLTPAFDAREVLQTIERERVTDLLLVPTMLQALITHPEFDCFDLRSLRRMAYGASPIAEPVLERAMAMLPEVAFTHSYGMTELGSATTNPPENHGPEGRTSGLSRSAGRANFGVVVRVVDPAGQELPRGQVGELIVSGPNLMLGYWGKPTETASALRGGWLYTGDGARMDDAGHVFIVDRLKDMIVSGGENVYSAEVENVIARHPAVQACAVIAVPHVRWGEAVHAVVVRKPGARLDDTDLYAHCRGSIAGYKCPKSIEFRDALPLSAAGKVLKRELREPHWAGQSRQVS